MKNNIITALLFLVIIGLVALIIMLAAGCATQPIYRVKSGDPEPPPEPYCTNCWTNSPLPFIDTNGIWLEVIGTVEQPSETPPFLIITRAHNLTNGVTYYWERTIGELGSDWIPLTSFVATGPTADRTNGIAAPDQHYWRLRWVLP